MTEDEAKTKWCPMVRYVSPRRFSLWGELNQKITAAINRWKDFEDTQTNPEMCRCIASECMMWRATDNEYAPENPSNPPDYVGGKPAGYCGLSR